MRLCDKLMYTRVFRSLFAVYLDGFPLQEAVRHNLGVNQETSKYFDIDYFKLSAPNIVFID
jgi:hypothetical protein